jgi:hypothetical protein
LLTFHNFFEGDFFFMQIPPVPEKKLKDGGGVHPVKRDSSRQADIIV